MISLCWSGSIVTITFADLAQKVKALKGMITFGLIVIVNSMARAYPT